MKEGGYKLKNATYHVSCLTIYLFSDVSGDSDGSVDLIGSGDSNGSGDSGDTDEDGKSTKLTQVWFKIYKIGTLWGNNRIEYKFNSGHLKPIT